MVGKTISHYKIQEKLGEGGMGVVFKAEDTSLDRTVALKFLSPYALMTEENKSRFAREAKAAASLLHPNVATIFEYGEADDPDSGQSISFIAMEYVDGQTLTRKINENPLPLHESLNIAIEIAEALSKAHEKSIIHRDIKSDNIMITGDGTAKVMDFGLADVKGNTKVTKEGTTVGTIAYMSPEQANSENLDHRCDIWSYGVVLYEMFAGTRPFQAAYEQALIYQILHEDHEPLINVRSDIPTELNQIVQKLLQKDPANRYQTMNDVLLDLQAFKKSLESGSEISKATTHRDHRLSLNKLRPVIFGAGLIFIAAILIWYFIPKSTSVKITSLAVLPFENITQDSDNEYFAAGMTDQLITELSKISSLHVIPRTTMMQFKGKYQTLQEIAKTLNVDGIVTATVFRSGEKMRLNANLIRAKDEKNLWNESYDRKIEDVLNLTSSLAQSITKEISATLTDNEQQSLSEQRSVNPKAFDLVARANFLISSSFDEKNLEKALEMMFRAVQIDPGYAQAHVGVAWALTHLLSFNFRTGGEVFSQAKAAIDEALDLDPELGLPYTLLGRIKMAQNDIEGAKTAYIKAMELSPNDGLVRTLYSWILMTEGRYEEGVREAEIAVELDPLSLFNRCNLEGWYYANQQYSEAKAEGSRILEMNPQWLPAIDMIRRIAVKENRLEDAVTSGRKYWLAMYSLQVPEDFIYQEFLQWEANTLERMASEGNIRASELALCYAELGAKDKTLKWLTVAEEKDEVVVHLLFYPEFNSLRNDPRFEDFVSRVNLPVNVYCDVELPN